MVKVPVEMELADSRSAWTLLPLISEKKLLKLDTTLLLLLFLPPTCPPSQASRTAINPPQPLTPIYVCRVSLHSAELIK